MNLDINLIKNAYKKLKQQVYYDNSNLTLRLNVAKFEDSPYFEEKLKNINEVLNAENPLETANFKEWIEQIKFQIIPKKIKQHSQEKWKFISNKTSEEKHVVEKVNYFIDAPVELHIMSILWIIVGGKHLDENLSEFIYGNRLHPSMFEDEQSSRLFKIYHKQYNNWRDDGIKKAKHILTNDKENVVILGLDIQSFYYSVDIKFDNLKEDIKPFLSKNEYKLFENLHNIIEEITNAYIKKISKYTKITHNITDERVFLPIGMDFSSIIANWYLKGFDENVIENINPIFYGRYADDILMVLRNIKIEEKKEEKEIENEIEKFVKKKFLDTGVLEKRKIEQEEGNEKEEYLLKDNTKNIIKNLKLQQSKFTIQYFDKNYSIATLEKFKKEIDKNSSAFRFLPEGDITERLDRVAYDLVYEGSVNKFSSVKGLSENRLEVSKFLSKQISVNQLVKSEQNGAISSDLVMFFKGKNAIEFYTLWEKVFTYFCITKEYKEIVKLYELFEKEIEKISFSNDDIRKISFEIDKKTFESEMKKMLIRNLKKHLRRALSMPISLNYKIIESLKKEKYFIKKSKLSSFLKKSTKFIRESNLMRHSYVGMPLLNYTNFDGNLFEYDISFYEKKEDDIEIEEKKETYSPRYIHNSERDLFEFYKFNLDEYEKCILESHKKSNKDFELKEDKYLSNWIFPNNKSKKIKIAIANMKVDEQNIKSSYIANPNINIEREYELWKLLNQVEQEKPDLLILPEVSVPHQWLAKLVTYCQKRNLALVVGLEHIIKNQTAYNFLVIILPFKTKNNHIETLLKPRLKNYYSPEEIHQIENQKVGDTFLKIPQLKTPHYDIFHWNGIKFSVLNCFEATNITDRARLKGKVDFLVISEHNKDIEYFSNIVESSSRDLHCYVAQVNTSEYGDSRIIKPAKSYLKNIVRVTGGENQTILTATIDIDDLRDFQNLGYPLQKQKGEFKPIPADFKRN